MHPDIRRRLREISNSVSVAKMSVTGVSGVTAEVETAGHTASHLAVTPRKPENHQQNQCATPVTPCHTLELQGGDMCHTLQGVADRMTEGVAAVSPDLEERVAHFEERAAIREYEGGFARAEAERLALDETIATLGPQPATIH